MLFLTNEYLEEYNNECKLSSEKYLNSYVMVDKNNGDELFLILIKL